MVKPKVSLDDIPVGRPRVQRVEPTHTAQEPEAVLPALTDAPNPAVSETVPETLSHQQVQSTTSTPKMDAPRTPQPKAANERGGLRALKALRPQRGEYVLSVSLEERLRDRLARASFESKVKQTNIVREALDEFLRKEGY